MCWSGFLQALWSNISNVFFLSKIFCSKVILWGNTATNERKIQKKWVKLRRSCTISLLRKGLQRLLLYRVQLRTTNNVFGAGNFAQCVFSYQNPPCSNGLRVYIFFQVPVAYTSITSPTTLLVVVVVLVGDRSLTIEHKTSDTNHCIGHSHLYGCLRWCKKKLCHPSDFPGMCCEYLVVREFSCLVTTKSVFLYVCQHFCPSSIFLHTSTLDAYSSVTQY